MNITVYLGSGEGRNHDYRSAAAELGRWIAGHGHRLIYGGSKIGLMGVLAESAVRAGGDVVGVEPEFFIQQEVQYEDITELITAQTMPERKKIMIDLGDAFIAFPGGTGTLEEISEVISRLKLGLLSSEKKCILYNLYGFYDPLIALLDEMVQEEFLRPEERTHVRSAATLAELAAILQE